MFINAYLFLVFNNNLYGCDFGMSDRYTRKDAENATSRLAKALGKEAEGCWTRDKSGNLKSKVGCWTTDYNSIYGGAVINEMMNESGGVSEPFGSTRRAPREFVDSVRMAITAIDIYKKRR